LPSEPAVTFFNWAIVEIVMTILRIALLFLLAVMSAAVAAQLPNPYGLSINAETAKKLAAAAIAEAHKNGWNMAVTVVDTNGDLVYFEKMDATQIGSVDVSIDKARSATLYKRPTKAWQDVLAAGGDGLRVLRLKGAIPVEGGLPLVVDGKIVGAIGCSGGTSQQDGLACKAGADALNPK
jgi:glc operon protein GlcG